MDLAQSYYQVLNPRPPRFNYRRPTYAAAGILAFARLSPVPTNNSQIQVLMAKEFRKSDTPTLSFPGGKIADSDAENPMTTAIREFSEETRGVYDFHMPSIIAQLRDHYPHNFYYHQAGRYCLYFVEVPYLHDVQARFSLGKSVDDNTAELVWSSVQELEDIHHYNDANINPTRIFTNFVLELMQTDRFWGCLVDAGAYVANKPESQQVMLDPSVMMMLMFVQQQAQHQFQNSLHLQQQSQPDSLTGTVASFPLLPVNPDYGQSGHRRQNEPLSQSRESLQGSGQRYQPPPQPRPIPSPPHFTPPPYTQPAYAPSYEAPIAPPQHRPPPNLVPPGMASGPPFAPPHYPPNPTVPPYSTQFEPPRRFDPPPYRHQDSTPGISRLFRPRDEPVQDLPRHGDRERSYAERRYDDRYRDSREEPVDYRAQARRDFSGRSATPAIRYDGTRSYSRADRDGSYL